MKNALAELDKYYPGATEYEIAGLFFWQGEKDGGNAVHAAHYEQNLVNFILRELPDLRELFTAQSNCAAHSQMRGIARMARPEHG